MVHVFSQNLGGKGGASKSILDVIESLAHLKVIIHTCSDRFKSVNTTINPIPISLNDAKLYSNKLKFILKFIRQLPYHFNYNKYYGIAIVNSYGSHYLLNQCSNEFAVKIFISRGKPGYIPIKEGLKIMNNYDHIIYLNEDHKNEWQSVGCNIKSSIIHNLVKVSRENRIVNKGRFTISQVGRIDNIKDQKFIIDRIEEIKKAFPNVLIQFVGDDRSKYAAELKNIINDNHLQKYFHFTGHVKDASPYILGSDIVSINSKSEAFCRVLLEAVMLNKKVVVRQNANNSILSNNHVFNDDNYLSVINRVLKCNNDYKDLINKYSPEKFKRKWVGVIKQSLSI